MNTVLTVGKFDPLTKGHEFMLKVAASYGSVTVALGNEPDHDFKLPYNQRWLILTDFFKSIGAEDRVTIIPDKVSTKRETSSNGTIIDEGFWFEWIAFLWQSGIKAPQIVVTSDDYGGEIASRLSPQNGRHPVQWIPVDPDRELFPISASAFWDNPNDLYDMISDFSKPYVGTTIAVVGAESTGKSTMIKKLANRFGSPYAPEWGRILSERKPELDGAEFNQIFVNQTMMIEAAQKAATDGLAFTDTEAITTKLFRDIYLPEERGFYGKGESLIRDQRFDHYLVLAPNVPMVQDGTRILSALERQKFHNDLVGMLDQSGRSYTIINDKGFGQREEHCVHTAFEVREKKFRAFRDVGRRTD